MGIQTPTTNASSPSHHAVVGAADLAAVARAVTFAEPVCRVVRSLEERDPPHSRMWRIRTAGVLAGDDAGVSDKARAHVRAMGWREGVTRSVLDKPGHSGAAGVGADLRSGGASTWSGAIPAPESTAVPTIPRAVTAAPASDSLAAGAVTDSGPWQAPLRLLLALGLLAVGALAAGLLWPLAGAWALCTLIPGLVALGWTGAALVRS